MARATQDLQKLLSTIREASEGKEKVAFGDILDAVGTRSFGPILLVAGLIILAPIIGDIPGMPTAIGIFVLLTVGQILAGRSEVWLPKWMLKRTVSRSKLTRALDWLDKPARYVDKVTHPRWGLFVRRPVSHLLAVAALLVALGMPAMEVVPFSANAAGLILALLGLALIAHDGALALAALVITGALIVLLLMTFF
jgi:hypothetical protein